MTHQSLTRALSYSKFLQGVLKDPKGFSTLFPTGSVVAQTLGHYGQVSQSDSILELGVGSGAITEQLLKIKQPEARYVGLEKNQQLALELNRRMFDAEIFPGDASDLKKGLGEEKFDSIIASLPWTQFSENELRIIFNEVSKHLKSGGVFVFFICLHVLYLPAGQQVLRVFQETSFDLINRKYIYKNLPPVCVFQAT